MSAEILMVEKKKGNPSIEVIVGHAHWGNYKIKLWDQGGKNPVLVGEGFSGDPISDVIEIGKISALDGSFLSWKVISAALDPAAGDQYHVTVLLRQQGATVPNGVFQYSGILDSVKTVGGFVRLQVN